MTNKMEICPKCKEGYLRPTGEGSVGGENSEPFRETGSMRELRCDKCGHRQVNAELKDLLVQGFQILHSKQNS